MTTKEIYRSIAALDQRSDTLAFVWAVREQESLWFTHDHAFWAAAQKGQPNDEDIQKFLKTYGLLRGKAARWLAKAGSAGPERTKNNRSNFGQLAGKHARALVSNAADKNTEVWKDFGNELAKELGESVGKDGFFLKSATSKILWFHRPDIVPMYDRYVAKHTNCEPDEYYAHCYALLNRHRDAIAHAKALWGTSYCFDIRILDKYLWIRGKGEEGQKILGRFHRACAALGGIATTDSKQ